MHNLTGLGALLKRNMHLECNFFIFHPFLHKTQEYKGETLKNSKFTIILIKNIIFNNDL